MIARFFLFQYEIQENTMISIILTLLAVIALGILGKMVSGEIQ